MDQWLSFQFIFLGKKAYVSDNLGLKPIAGLEFAALVEVTAKICLSFHVCITLQLHHYNSLKITINLHRTFQQY